MAVRARSWNHIRLIVSPMTHNVSLYVRSLDKDNLAPSWVALGILHSRQCLCCDAGAVDNNPGGGAGVCGLDGGKPLSHKVHAILILQPVEEILDVLGGVER